MSLNRLLLIAITVPSIFVVGVILASYIPHRAGLLSHEGEHLTLALAMIAGIIPFSFFMLRIFHRIERHILSQNEQLSRRNNEMQALLKVGRAVEESQDLDTVLPMTLKAVLEATGTDAAEVWILDAENNELYQSHHEGVCKEAFQEVTTFPVGQGYPGMVAQNGKPLLVRDLPKDERFLTNKVKEQGFQTFYAVPLKRGGHIVGVLTVAAKNSDALKNENELRLIDLMAEHVATAIENAQLHEEVRTLAILGERERLAREMHDGLAQVLGYVNTKAQAVKELLKANQVEAAVKQMGQLEAAAQETYDDVREGILALGTNGHKRPILESLREYVKHFSDLSGMPAEFTVEGTPFSFDPATEVQLLRIAQEALANARKHSQGTKVKVVLSFNSQACRLLVEDDGQGFDPQRLNRGPWPHLGLKSMQERAAAIGATFTLDTTLGKGTKIILRVPKSRL